MKYGYSIWSAGVFVTGSDWNDEFFDTETEAKQRAQLYVRDCDENLDSDNNTYEIYEVAE